MLLLLASTAQAFSQSTFPFSSFAVEEIDNSLFKGDRHWRGADGAATVNLGNGKVLWLFSDTFVDKTGSGTRANAGLIRNSIGIQDGTDMAHSKMSFPGVGKDNASDSFFKISGPNWLWTGHGAIIRRQLVIFLMEVATATDGLGFQVVGWHIALIQNAQEIPENWKIAYISGVDTHGVIVGSSAVLSDEDFLYAYGVKEPGSHEVFLLKFEIEKLLSQDVKEFEWWDGQQWLPDSELADLPAPLFVGQTEFSVHYQSDIQQYMQVQTYGFGQAEIGIRTASKPEGPWSESTMIYKPVLRETDLMYSANAHPELQSDGLIITYNVNNVDFSELVRNENLYFPKIIKFKF